MKMGYKNVYALKGGWNEWVEAGYPVEPKEPKE
jgi:3-mercaptopyruvate sulfurtransferase SseA